MTISRECYIRFGADVCQDLSQALSKEWLETHGNGGYASSTITGLNTRRYHGLLVGAYAPGLRRIVLVSKLEEWVEVEGERHPLSSNQYQAAIYPDGYANLHRFVLDPYPRFEYRAGAAVMVKSVFAVPEANATVVRYELMRAPGSVVLRIVPLLAVRDYHHLVSENASAGGEGAVLPGRVRFELYAGAPAVWIRHSGGSFLGAPEWYRGFEYQRELERGLEYREDLLGVGTFEANLEPGGVLELVLADSDPAGVDTAEAEERRRERRPCFGGRTLARGLSEASHHFMVRRPDGRATVVAGYHWFADWGRDTLIALPGLALGTERYDFVREVLETWLGSVEDGLVPNRFPEGEGHPDFNSVDAALWLFHAVEWYCRRTDDWRFGVERALPVMAGALDRLAEGTRYGIRAEADGLLRAGGPEWQLTWMDAKVGDWVVTPRSGKAVEVNALWYNAMRVTEALARRGEKKDLAGSVVRRARRAARSFVATFWNESAGMLYDCVDGDLRDESVRPNQILAISLHYPVLPRRFWRPVVDAVRRELLTPYGLRTLAAWDERYRGRYGGPQVERDGAYHQGTIWPWLLGHFVTAYLRAYGKTAETRAEAVRMLSRFSGHLREAGLGAVSEIFEGDAPHWPVGCVAQAWSVGELLRALTEGIGPRAVRLDG